MNWIPVADAILGRTMLLLGLLVAATALLGEAFHLGDDGGGGGGRSGDGGGGGQDQAVHHRVKRWEDFPNATFTFDCTDRSIGFYADLEFDCMIFHLCDAQGRRIPYMCDKNTAFNQRFRVCDWAYNVDCESSPSWYYLNDLTYREDKRRR